MLNQLLLRFALLLICLPLFQSAYTQGLKIGVRCGIVLANLDVDPKEEDAPDYKNVLGYQVAVPIEIGFGDMFAIQPEIMYGLHGLRVDETMTETDGGFTATEREKATLRIQTLEIPLLGKVKFGTGAFKIYVLAGPSFGFGLSGKNKDEYTFRETAPDGSVVEDSEKESYDVVFVKDGYQQEAVDAMKLPITKTNFNLHLGGGLNVNVGKMTVFLDGRYMLGLSDLFPETEGTADENKTTAKSRRMGISAGILLPLH